MAFDKIIGDMKELFDGIDHQVAVFAQKSGLKCKNGCGACCATPEIETTVAEVLPLAAYLWSKGLSLRKLEDIRSNPSPKYCILYEPDPLDHHKGRCNAYTYRPGICRLFGFATRQDKHGRSVLVTCKVIKEDQSQACQQTQESLYKGLEAPLLSAHSLKVSNIDPVHGNELLPINQAIVLAIEKIGYSIEGHIFKEKIKQ